MFIAPKHAFKIDWMLFFSMMCIPILGLIVLYSAGYDPDITKPYISFLPVIKSIPFLKQLLFISLGLCGMFISSMIDQRILHRLALPIYTIGVVLLCIVDFMGMVSKGSQRWLTVGGFNLQPAEFMKLGVILALSRYLSTHLPQDKGYKLIEIVIPSLIFLIPMALIIKQPDLGTALAVGGVGASMLLYIGVRLKVLLFLFLIGISILPLAWSKLHGYQQSRIISLFNPEIDPKGSGYHIIQSKIAVGSGELSGKGYLKGTQTQLEFLPEHTTDFIFSVLAEEWGFVGCVVVLFFYLFFVYRLLLVALKAKDIFSTLVVVGITAMIFFHTFVNISMVIGLLPVVGIPLPLFSYGGSSVVSTMFGTGLVFGISRKQRVFSGFMLFVMVFTVGLTINQKVAVAEMQTMISEKEAPFSDEVLKKLIHAVTTNSSFYYVSQKEKPPSEKLFKDVWAGTTEISTVDLGAEILFEKKSDGSVLPVPLDLKIKMAPKKLVISGSWIKEIAFPNRDFAGFERIVETSKTFIGGYDRSMIVFIPIHQDIARSMGFIACINEPKVKVEAARDSSGFVVKQKLSDNEQPIIIPTKTAYTGKALIEGGYRTNFKEDIAEAKIVANDSFQILEPLHDMSRKNNPLVNLIYSNFSKKPYIPYYTNTIETGSNVSSGVLKIYLKYHNFLGFKREMLHKGTLSVRRIQVLSEQFEKYIRLLGRNKILRGPLMCFGVIREDVRVYEYTKEDYK
jgi:rod shape determining protein RodA